MVGAEEWEKGPEARRPEGRFCPSHRGMGDYEVRWSGQEPLTFIAFLTEPEPITQILLHIGEPTSPLPHPPSQGTAPN